MQNKYTLVITYSEVDKGYLADVPDLPFCTAFGYSPQKALEEVERAMAAWLRAAKQLKKPIPEPRPGFNPGEM